MKKKITFDNGKRTRRQVPEVYQKTFVYWGADKIGHIQTHNGRCWRFTDYREHPLHPNCKRTYLWATSKEELQRDIIDRWVESSHAIYKGERLEDFFLKPEDTRSTEEIKQEVDLWVYRTVGADHQDHWVRIDYKKYLREVQNESQD